VMGGTGPDSQPLGFADQVFFSRRHQQPLQRQLLQHLQPV